MGKPHLDLDERLSGLKVLLLYDGVVVADEERSVVCLEDDGGLSLGDGHVELGRVLDLGVSRGQWWVKGRKRRREES